MKKIRLSENQVSRLFLVENRVDFLRNQYVNKPVKNADRQQIITDEIFEKIVSADPSINKQYSQWLLNLYYWKQLKLEDLYKATQYLEVFDKNKNRMPEKDINKKTSDGFYYNSLQKLFDVVKPYLEQDNEDSMSDSALVKKIKKEESEKYYEDSEWLIVIPKTKRASCIYGKGTQWCTAADVSNNMFDEYNKQGKLYICIHKPTNKKYQFYFESSQFMDENDEETKILFLNNTLLNIFKDKLGRFGAIDLDNFNIHELPENFKFLYNISDLYLSHNLLESLPNYLKHFKNLETLIIAYNNFKTIPNILFDMKQLTFLNLAANPIPYNQEERDALQLALPNTKINYRIQ